jgi:predicted kinase
MSYNGHMQTPTLILIIGLPGTGKTILGKKLAHHLGLPLLSKDTLKEIMFDDLGWSDREWSKKIGNAAYHLMDYLIEEQLKTGNSLIIESTFSPTFDNPKFQKWQKQYNCNVIQTLCYTQGDVLLERFIKRAKTNEVHPGHAQATTEHMGEFKEQLLKGKAETLDLAGSVVEVDTTDFSKVDDVAIAEEIRSLL